MKKKIKTAKITNIIKPPIEAPTAIPIIDEFPPSEEEEVFISSPGCSLSNYQLFTVTPNGPYLS